MNPHHLDEEWGASPLPHRCARICRQDTVRDLDGSETNGISPNRAAKKPTQTAPYKPPKGPTPEATPKANARSDVAEDIAPRVIKLDEISDCHHWGK
jgi:hypothetical protein